MTSTLPDNNPKFANLRSSLALAGPTDRSLALEYLLNEARDGKLSSADPSVLRRVDATLQKLPERLGPSAEAIAEVERRRCRFLDTHRVEIPQEGGVRAEPQGTSLAQFLMDADDIIRLSHQKPLLHREEFRSWLEAAHPAVTGSLPGAIEVAPGSPTVNGNHRAVTFNVSVRELITAQAAHLVATGESLLRGCRGVASDGVVDFQTFGLYLPGLYLPSSR